MRTFILYFTALCLCTFSLTAQQTPKSFSFQGVAKDADGIVTGGIGLQFTIQQGTPGGQTVYRERQFPQTNEDGVFSVNIGGSEAIVIQGSLDEVDWSQGTFFLKVELDPNGAASYTDMGTTQLLSVPFAMHADQARTVLEETDGDPTNEIQTLQLSNGNLLLSNGGGSVNLEEYESQWLSYSSSSGIGITYAGFGEVAIGSVLPSTFGNAGLAIGGDTRYQKQGQNSRMLMGVDGGNSRIVMDNTLTGYSLVFLGTNIGDEYGTLRLRDYDQTMCVLTRTVSGGGFLETYSPSGDANVVLSSLSSNTTHGYVGVKGTTGTNEAGIYVNSSGQGVVFADIKNFRMPHPSLPDHDIWYASLEGGEAAAYARGTTTLVNGEVFVPYSDDFSIVVNSSTVTISLTPLSASSTGLAVIEKKEDGFLIKELNQGTGNYQIDWEVKGVRKGFEDYEIVRHRSSSEPSEAVPNDIK